MSEESPKQVAGKLPEWVAEELPEWWPNVTGFSNHYLNISFLSIDT
ncbi:MAG: hypothetical protein IIB45_11945 [Candidatus Marinimicrobia bacterium]|nr:hypothetical protein [Candidatus Neomarinimicrobiota bacterium]